MSEQPLTGPPADPTGWRALQPGQVRSLAGTGLAAMVLIAATELADAFSAWASWRSYFVVRDYLAEGGKVTVADLEAADRFTSVTAWAYVVAFLAAGIVFLTWLWSARQNAEMLCAAPHRRTRGWLTGSWFCPVVNLWFPYQIMDDIYRASRPDTPRDLADLRAVSGSPLLGWWWALWLATIPATIVATANDDVTVDSLRVTAIADTASALSDAGAAVLIILIMRRITAWQTRGPAEPEGS
jgi:Domain of unknown function (DUF4328)